MIYYEAVRVRVGQDLAELKNLDCLKMCFLGPSLAPDDVTSKTVFLVLLRWNSMLIVWSQRRLNMKKNNMCIVISTFENPQNHFFRESRFLSCANPHRICLTLTQTASYNKKLLYCMLLMEELEVFSYNEHQHLVVSYSIAMTKYVIPSAGIGAFLSSYFGWGYFTKEKKLSSLKEAVDCLNESTRVDEAIDFILRSDIERSRDHLSSLSTRSLGALAGHGWMLVNSVPVRQFPKYDTDMDIEKILQKFDLGAEFQAALDWLNRVPCDEDELSCTDEWFGRRPSRLAYLQRILQVLFLKTEKPSNAAHLDTTIVQFLYTMWKGYREDNKELAVLALKTLANIAALGESYANAILESEWLRVLSNLVINGISFEERIIAHKVFRNALHSLRLIQYSLPSDVYELYLSMGEPVIDVVLIHGLRGSVNYTWRQKDYFHNKTLTECWPKDWLPRDIADPIRIIGIEYPSYLLAFTGTMESLQSRSDRFADQLERAGVGSRPVVFICHSMGGLLAKKLVLDWLQLRGQTVGILFIATPHKGSPIADAWGYDFIPTSEDVRLLRQSNELNKKLDRDFSSIHDSIPIITSMVETKASNLGVGTKGIVVPRESAVYSRGSLYHIEEIHHDMCKPSERSSPSYLVVLNFLRDSIVEAKKRPPPATPK
ncbi:hypothetical protein PRIPAC_97394 [Pristionchus pacificus]|uniref:GPI inositol-deacylase n=1 Tax=Pristionchus pacificus TaxID=54126 RepID=A0A2A6B2D7_PRIPA|nr:hypothetical protein PRIPAC_97394 [Pristionchus pacificus]|eukprot:PDM60031.1 hypothetical protein PRIPAC_49317 [Pristionchus pacificus]